MKSIDDYLSFWAKLNEDRDDCRVTIGDINLMVRKNTFSPDPQMTNSTSQMLKHFPDVKNKTVLDIGTGTGILALFAALNGARHVTAVDVDNDAIENASENIKEHKLEDSITLFESDLFTNVEGKFDVILAQWPIAPCAWEHLEHPVFNLYQNFLNQLEEHLLPNGKCLVTSASFGDVEALKRLLEKSGFSVETFAEEKFGVIWYVFVLK